MRLPLLLTLCRGADGFASMLVDRCGLDLKVGAWIMGQNAVKSGAGITIYGADGEPLECGKDSFVPGASYTAQLEGWGFNAGVSEVAYEVAEDEGTFVASGGLPGGGCDGTRAARAAGAASQGQGGRSVMVKASTTERHLSVWAGHATSHGALSVTSKCVLTSTPSPPAPPPTLVALAAYKAGAAVGYSGSVHDTVGLVLIGIAALLCIGEFVCRPKCLSRSGRRGGRPSRFGRGKGAGKGERERSRARARRMLEEGDDDDDGRRALTRGPFDEGSSTDELSDECEDEEAKSTSPTASFTEHSTELTEAPRRAGLIEYGDEGPDGEGVTIDDSEHESAAGSAVSSLSGSGVRPPHGHGRGMSAPLATSHEFRAKARDGASSEVLRAEF